MHWAVILTGDSSRDTVLSFAGEKVPKKNINKVKKKKGYKCCHCTNHKRNGGGRKVLTEQPGSERCRRWVERPRNCQPMDDVFCAEEWEPEQQYLPLRCGPAGTYASHAGRDDSLLVKFPTLQDSAFTLKRLSQNHPEEPQMHQLNDRRKRNLCYAARGPKYDGRDGKRQVRCTDLN